MNSVLTHAADNAVAGERARPGRFQSAPSPIGFGQRGGPFSFEHGDTASCGSRGREPQRPRRARSPLFGGANRRFTLAILAFALACVVKAEDTVKTNDTPHAILFANGDTLTGRLLSMDGQQVIRWTRPDLAKPVEFLPAAAAEIRFNDSVQPESNTQSNRCLIKLTNMDELEGGLKSLDERELVLETTYAGTLRVPRSRLQTILPLSPQLETVFSGPTGIEGWTIGKVNALIGDSGQWRYLNGAFYAKEAASIARDLKLPAASSLEFDIEWRGMLNLAVALYTDYMQPVSLRDKENEPDFGGFYSLQINSQVASLLFVNKKDPLRQLGQAIVPALAQKNQARITIKCSRTAPQISLLVDGAVVRQWTDVEGFGGQGTGIRLVHQGQGMVRLSDLHVTEWDGRFEEAAVVRPDANDELILLVNSDKMAARLTGIHDGTVTLMFQERQLKVPLNRVSQIEMSSGKQVREPVPKDSMRGWLAHRGSVTFTVETWDERGVVATSPCFGRATFDPSVMSRLEFHVGK